ncbi:hypothetical protein MWU58_06170 [Flavobacteriaceae bacterium S0825]|uniref:hypothetical protein n=1 Tax=Gaetbulibacter sp. S0825 TaxID=2720084 RepID=UPI001431DBA1|nr:hypothetical protein [Gaetbulibacter sp. S0825]MCK0108870.1 hypothetical protein [Flavobacteriaceae bacterium S0825]NIX64506.1 hypothetical protein [Gaetbulibacter sp. S0825]
MKQLLFLFTFCLLTSCNKRVVQLPETTNKGITEVVDISPVYMFYDEETDSVEFNRRNMISSTNWLVNIDKRLTLKQILPHLQYLQEKRQGNEKHSFHNYFTCNNTDLKNLSFIEFTDVVYEEESEQDGFKRYLNQLKKRDSTFFIYKIIDLKPSMELIVSSNSIIGDCSLEEEISLSQLNNYFKINSSDISAPLILRIYQNTKFQDYIKLKTLLNEIDNDSILISNHEFIYN